MDPIIEKLTTARVGLLLKTPFFGNMATRMRLIEANDWCPTAATNGRDFYYNTDFVKKLSIKKLEFLFAHEICHCVFDHFGRAGSRDRRLCNIAQDFAVNQILVDERIGEKITEVDICYDSKYRGMAWEEIYDLLEEERQKMPQMSMEEFLDKLGDLLDEHINEDGDKEGKDGKPKMTKEEAQALKDEIKQAMIQSASACEAGKIPAGIQRLIKDLTEPKMNWREVLQMNIQSIIRNDYSFQRPNRKSQHSGAVLPGMKNDETIDVAIALDMSGSIGQEDATVFLSEVKGIMDQYQDYKIDIFCFDTEIYNHQTFDQDSGDDLLNYEPQGGGGTDFDACYEYMKSIDLVPKKFIMFTDGYPFGSWGDEDYCDSLFIVKGSDRVSPFGQTVLYDEKTKATA